MAVSGRPSVWWRRVHIPEEPEEIGALGVRCLLHDVLQGVRMVEEVCECAGRTR